MVQYRFGIPASKITTRNWIASGGILDRLEEEHPEWDVHREERGHFFEPHTFRKIGFATGAVRSYLACSPTIGSLEVIGSSGIEFALGLAHTHGPADRFSGLLLVEKLGLLEVLKSSGIDRKYDVALASTSGMSTKAAREVVDVFWATHQVPTFVLHDFDIQGINIWSGLSHSNAKYTYSQTPLIIDLGLRLDDITKYHLMDEQYEFKASNGKTYDPRPKLTQYGLNQSEIDFMMVTTIAPFIGKRVELNALGGQFAKFVDDKLAAYGVQKVIPSNRIIEAKWRRNQYLADLNSEIREIDRTVRERILNYNGTGKPIAAPDDLRARIEQKLIDHPTMSWDEAINDITDDDN
jgi:hypothetical protein